MDNNTNITSTTYTNRNDARTAAHHAGFRTMNRKTPEGYFDYMTQGTGRVILLVECSDGVGFDEVE